MLSMELTTLRLRRVTAAAAAGAPAAELTAALDECKAALASGRTLLEALSEGGDPGVAAAFHRTTAEYHRIRGPAAAFYDAALLWLGCTPLETLPEDVRSALAVDVALAALVGEGVYNFGEGAWPRARSVGDRSGRVSRRDGCTASWSTLAACIVLARFVPLCKACVGALAPRAAHFAPHPPSPPPRTPCAQ